MSKCKGLHCDGCGHGGGAAGAVIALLVIIAVGMRKAWPGIVHGVEIAAWTVTGVAGAVLAVTGTVLTVRAVRRVRARCALRQTYYAHVIPAVRLTDRSALDRPEWPARPALGQPPRRQPGTWPLAGLWEDEHPWTGGDGNERRPR
jgi:hypothetical protein